MRAPAQIIEDGRVTIPVDIRNELDLQKGEYVILDVQPVGDQYD